MHPDIEKLVESGKLPREAGEFLSELEPGTYCEHKSWGYGKIAKWDLLGDRVMIDFNEKPAHPMKLEFVARSVKPLPEGHVMTLYLSDPEGVRKMALEETTEFVRLVLESQGGSASLDEFDNAVCGTVVKEDGYKRWWESTKKKLRQDRRFVVPPNRRDPLELRDANLTPAEALAADFEAVGDMKARAKAFIACAAHVGDFKEEPDILKRILDTANELISKSLRLHPGPCFEMLLARNVILEADKSLVAEDQPEIEDLLHSQSNTLADFIPKLPIAAQRAAYDSFPGAFGDEWDQKMLDVLGNSGLRSAGEMAKVLQSKGREDLLVAHLRKGVQERRLPSDLLAWICRERKAASEKVFGSDGELAGAILNSMEKDHLDENARKSSRLQEALVGDADLMADLVADCEPGAARSLGRRLLGSPAFDDLSRRSLLARIIKVHPKVEEIMATDSTRSSGSVEALIVSWESYEAKKLELENLVNKRIPANKKEIQTAREYGDLSENFEYKAAKQEEEKLRAERQLMDADLKRARGSDFKGADTSQVSIGTTVKFAETNDGSEESYAILGAWDTDIEKGIVSYLSDLAQSLLGATVGQTVEIPSGEQGVVRKVVIKEILPYFS